MDKSDGENITGKLDTVAEEIASLKAPVWQTVGNLRVIVEGINVLFVSFVAISVALTVLLALILWRVW
jgi:hypothetical protein